MDLFQLLCSEGSVGQWAVLMEGEAQASLHWPAAVGAAVDAAAKPHPLVSAEAGLAAGDPAGQVLGHFAPVEALCDLSLADSLADVTHVVMELLQNRVHLESKGSLVKKHLPICICVNPPSFILKATYWERGALACIPELQFSCYSFLYCTLC